MGYILGVLGYIAYIAADVDFYNIEGNSGDSYLPFVGFMLFLIGFVVIFMGFSKYLTAKKNFNLFYDQRDSVNIDKATNQKNKNVGIIMMAAGLMFLIISFFVI
ncbi:MAG TPA: hypothetical protein DC028_04820 [Eubacterium sp.]|jgi:hypothetical protein|nr:hypothetical protein [Eubacterium sp.]